MQHATLRSMLVAEQVTPDRVRPLKRVEYDRLVELGVFEDEKLELLRGALVTMSPQGLAHSRAVVRLDAAFHKAIGDRAIVCCQVPFAASGDSEPEPDLAVVPKTSYIDDQPTAAYLIVEVAASSLRKDREAKRDVYAEAGVPEYWIVNVAERVVEVYRVPVEGRYTERQQVGPEATLRLVEFPDVELAVGELF